jgi:hypothetical protein
MRHERKLIQTRIHIRRREQRQTWCQELARELAIQRETLTKRSVRPFLQQRKRLECAKIRRERERRQETERRRERERSGGGEERERRMETSWGGS